MKQAKIRCMIFLVSIILLGAAFAADNHEGNHNKEFVNKNQQVKRKRKLGYCPQENTQKVNNCLGSLCP